jgi:hypothetical protein
MGIKFVIPDLKIYIWRISQGEKILYTRVIVQVNTIFNRTWMSLGDLKSPSHVESKWNKLALNT